MSYAYLFKYIIIGDTGAPLESLQWHFMGTWDRVQYVMSQKGFYKNSHYRGTSISPSLI